MRMTRGKIAATAAGLLALTALAGCEKSTPEPVRAGRECDQRSRTDECGRTGGNPDARNREPHRRRTRATPVDPDAQTLDDADATGMTARIRRDEATANETVQ